MTVSFVDAPDADTNEVTLFGKGYGEAMVFHSRGEWFVVDSFHDPESMPAKVPIALRYLNDLGIPDDAVKVVIATHWHDDHAGGLFQLYKQYARSKFACAEALTTQEFLTLAEAYAGVSYAGATKRSNLSEWRNILNEDDFPERLRSVSAGTSIWRQPGTAFEVYALSPSSAEGLKRKAAIASMLPQRGLPQVPPVGAGKPNHAAVAMVVNFADRSILLGSDLEVTTSKNCGWDAALDQLTTQTDWKSFFYKIAHHGSETAHHHRIWRDALVPNPIGGVTPFINGSHRLPGADNIRRLKPLHAHLIQAPEVKVQSKAANSTAQSVLKNVGIKYGRYRPSLGALRIRWRDGEPGTSIELFGSAEAK